MDKILVFGLTGQSVFLTVNQFGQIGETTIANSIHIEPGGKGFNQAVTIKRLGGNVHYFSIIGEDDAGKTCQDFLDKEGISYTLLKPGKDDLNDLVYKTSDAFHTCIAYITTDKNANNIVTVYPGIMKRLTVEDIYNHQTLFNDCKIVLIQFEIGLDLVKAIIDICNKLSIKVILNPAPCLDIKELPVDIFTILNKVMILTPNYQEAINLFSLTKEMSYEDIVTNVRSKTSSIVIITLGSQGCLVITKDEFYHLPSKKVVAVDTTGAGDVFNGALAYMFANNKTLKEAVEYSSYVASLSVTKRYVMPAIPYGKDI